MAAIVRASHPISFQLLNSDRQPILGIFDGQQAQTLKLEISNSSRRNMKTIKLAGTDATAENHHFELRFRPGTLVLTGAAISVDESSGWRISRPAVTDEGVSFYLLITNSTVIETDKAISVTLNNLSGDGKRGAHGTRVALKWKQGSLEYVASDAGQSPEPLVPGHRIQHLSVVNESGQKHIPLHVGIVGNNKVLNNGSPNVLKLHITNLLKEGNIQLNKKSSDKSQPPASEFILSFDASPKPGSGQPEPPSVDWSLAYTDQVEKISISVPNRKFEIEKKVLGQSTQWNLWPKDDPISLKPNEAIDVVIDQIITNLPPGQTNLYVHYKNIPGYWDGDFVTRIEKAPLVYKEATVAGVKEQRVGIGTSDPAAKLHVAGKLRVDNEVAANGVRLDKNREVFFEETGTIRSGDDGHRIMFRQTEDKLEFRERGQIIFSPGSANGSETAKVVMTADGRVGMGETNPATHLHLRGGADQQIMIESMADAGVKWSLQSSAAAGRFEVINRSAGQNRFTILKDGNVGIGTVIPGSYINEGNYFKADAQGRIVEVHSPTRESVLILSTNQDADGAHLGGLYFTRTAGQSDAHREVAAIKCRQQNAGSLGGGILQFFTKPSGGGANFNNPRMVIRENGRVGIGTDNPKALLEVKGAVDAEAIAGYRFMNIHVTENDHRRQTRPYSIWASDRIAADEFNAVSDERIKNIQGRSDGATDLCTLLGIEITDYGFRDVIGKGAGTCKKVIGQQVEKVFPQAVSRQTDVVPDIYQQAPIQDGWVALATDLKKGDRVKLITEQGKEDVHEVLEASEDKFRVDLEHEGGKVFVFGREVDDLVTVDYDAIAMLNVSATQQLKKEMDQELKTLRVENAELRAANDALAKRLQLLESRLELALGVMPAAGASNGNGKH